MHLHVARVARRVERLRGLRFRTLPRVVVLQPDQLARVGRRLRNQAVAKLARTPGRVASYRSRVRAQSGFETLAGLLPGGTAIDASASGASELVGGAYDYHRNRVILIDRVAATRRDVERILAHELTHALEDQHFNLHFATSRGAGQRAQARRALIEGTATFVASRYDGRYLHNQLSIGIRIAGQRSVLAAGGATPFAVKANTVFDYVDGPLFVQRLYRRVHGWRLVNAALGSPPETTRGILHPSLWPRRTGSRPARLHLRPLLAPSHFLAGTGVAGEEDLLGLLSSGAPDQIAETAADGWRGGRFQLWRLTNGSCPDPCVAEDVGVIAIRLRGSTDRLSIGDAFFDYSLLGRLGQRLTLHTWRFLDGSYGAIRFGPRSAAIAFAPGQALAGEVAARAARQASRG